MAVRFDADGEDYSQNITFDNSTVSGCCWVRIDVDRNNFSTFIDFSNAGNDAFGVQTAADGVLWQIYSSSNGTSNLFTATVGTWYFIAFAKGPNNGDTAGYWAAANTLALSSSTGLDHNVGASIPTIMVGESGFSGEWLNGSIAAVKVWSGVRLTQAEFERERFQYLPHRTSNLHSFWPFLQGGANTGARQDFSGNANNLGGGTNSATTDGPPIPWREGTQKIFIPAAAAGNQTITCTGIASAEAFGTTGVQLNIDTTGIASAEAFGTPSVQLNINTTGIASAEAFGTPSLELNINANGIPSAEAFGTPTVSNAAGTQTITAVGIPSAEAFGSHVLTGGAVTEVTFNTFMGATVTLSTQGEPIYRLMEETLGTFPRLFQGRVANVSIQHLTGTFYLVYKVGTVNLATDAGFEFADSPGKRSMQFEARDSNQLSMGEFILAGAVGGETARVLVFIV